MIEIVRKPERESGWTIADMKPSEVASWNGNIIIALQCGSNVELHTPDEHRMTSGERGNSLKKHFFFNMDTQQVLAIVGSDPVEPYTLRIEATPGHPDFRTASNASKYGGISTPPEITHRETQVPYHTSNPLDNGIDIQTPGDMVVVP
jgi:hypothetical protein